MFGWELRRAVLAALEWSAELTVLVSCTVMTDIRRRKCAGDAGRACTRSSSSVENVDVILLCRCNVGTDRELLLIRFWGYMTLCYDFHIYLCWYVQLASPMFLLAIYVRIVPWMQ
jgi:hypothetical protein